jgi:hypothetical protein
MSAEDLERYETEIELQLYQEYRAVLPMFRYVVETAWVWDMYRPARFVSSVRVVTFKDVNVEELPEKEL